MAELHPYVLTLILVVISIVFIRAWRELGRGR